MSIGDQGFDAAARDPLDALLQPWLVVDPPPELQARLVASALLVAEARPLTTVGPMSRRAELSAPGAGSWNDWLRAAFLYVTLGAVLLVSMVWTGLIGDVETLLLVGESLLRALSLIARSPAGGLVDELAGRAADLAIWLLLVPVIWVLWERDRAPIGRR